ncbi:MAG: galactokinase [Thermodesulfobacteriota bacterium]|nr:galactokinase [Thermodesulfobacteriota bacterium]
MKDLKRRLESHPVDAWAPCRIDCGGTLDIKTLYYTLGYLSPCTFNIALNLKTRVRLRPYTSGLVKVSSRGFQSEVHPADRAPFDSPLGLMLAVAACFRVGGVHIDIMSESPPKSALGGSSSAAVALTGALSMTLGDGGHEEKIVLLAHAIEEAIAGVPCGLQDHLAAAYGGVHVWSWPSDPTEPPFKRREVLTKKDYEELENRLLVAYCGVPHESSDINTKWIRGFLAGKDRHLWSDIAGYTKTFVKALGLKDWTSAAQAMNKEVESRREMTPEVFDPVGRTLLEVAMSHHCGARFTGAGGGGCIWALGEARHIQGLQSAWTDILSTDKEARLLQGKVDPEGLEVTSY